MFTWYTKLSRNPKTSDKGTFLQSMASLYLQNALNEQPQITLAKT